MELVKFPPIQGYSVNIFSYSGPSGILCSEGKQNTTKAGARGHGIVVNKTESAVF